MRECDTWNRARAINGNDCTVQCNAGTPNSTQSCGFLVCRCFRSAFCCSPVAAPGLHKWCVCHRERACIPGDPWRRGNSQTDNMCLGFVGFLAPRSHPPCFHWARLSQFAGCVHDVTRIPCRNNRWNFLDRRGDTIEDRAHRRDSGARRTPDSAVHRDIAEIGSIGSAKDCLTY